MRKFIDITEENNENYLSSVAMIFNDTLIENEIDGYTTLNVAGREKVSYRMKTEGGDRDGVIMKSKYLDARIITVTFEMWAMNNHHLQEQFRMLSFLLNSDGDVEFSFRDDPNIHYYGQMTEISEIPPDSNQVVGKFSIYCSDPYKYSKGFAMKGNPVQFYDDSPYPSKPNDIKVTVGKNTDKLIVRNESTGRRIILDGDYKKNDVIKIDIKGGEIKKNGQNIMKDLSYTETDFNKFLVKSEDVISVTPAESDLEVVIKGRWI